MKKDLQNLNNCPKNGVAVTEVNKEDKIQVIQNLLNKDIQDRVKYGCIKGEGTPNRTNTVIALYKLSEHIIHEAIAKGNISGGIRRVKPKTSIEMFEHTCTVLEYHINANDIFKFYESFVHSGREYSSKLVSDFVSKYEISVDELKNIIRGFNRLMSSRYYYTQAEWLELSLGCLTKDASLIDGLDAYVKPVVNYEFCLDSILETTLARRVTRIYKDSNDIKTIHLSDVLFKINEKSDTMLQITPVERYMNEIFRIPTESGFYQIEIISMLSLEMRLSMGDTLEEYRVVMQLKGSLPESEYENILDKVNKNRIKAGLNEVIKS